MMDLKSIVENRDTTAGRIFGLTVQILIILSVITFSIETLPNLEASTRELLGFIEIFVVLMFNRRVFSALLCG